MSTTNESAIQADATMRYGAPTIYECGICGAYHPWTFNGDCRNDSNRGYPDEFAQRWDINEFDIRIVSMEERVDADANTTEDN